MVNSYEPVRDFLILHYHANRRERGRSGTSSAIWPLPDTLQHKIELFREHGRVFRYNEELFDVPSWIAVMLGQGIDSARPDPLVDAMPDREVLRAMADLGQSYEQAAERMPLASDYIERRISAGLVDGRRCGLVAQVHARPQRCEREQAQDGVANRRDQQRRMIAGNLRKLADQQRDQRAADDCGAQQARRRFRAGGSTVPG